MTISQRVIAPCDVLADGEYSFDQFPEDNFLIAHDTVNDTIRVSAYGVVYEGTVQRLNGGPNDGEAVLRACGGDFEGYREVLRIQHIVVQAPGEARFDGKSFYVLPDGPVYGTCSYLFTRVSTDEPEIPPCTY